MKSIVEISYSDTLEAKFAASAEAILISAEGGPNRRGPFDVRRQRVFIRLARHSDVDQLEFSDQAGLAIEAPNCQADLDLVSASLRLTEAKLNHADRSIRLVAFLFPDLASLARPAENLIGSERLAALAFDEAALASHLPIDNKIMAAPLIYARARVVAAARAISRPAYVKPRWLDSHADNLLIIEAAKQDGFDGLIGPPDVIDLINNA